MARLTQGSAKWAEMAVIDYGELIAGCRRNLGNAPRRFSPLIRVFLKQAPPSWLVKSPQDPLWEQVRVQDRLLSDGVLVWGHLVQANTLLFKAGPMDHPASIVISFDPEADSYPVRLEVLAEEIFSRKGTKPADADLATLSDPITDEYERHAVKVADKFVGLNDCHMVSVLVSRKQLPAGRITGTLFPILALPGETPAVTILPSRFWDKRLKALHAPR